MSSLSVKALKDLKVILAKEIGEERTSKLSNDDLNHLGQFLLTVFAESLKAKEGLID